MRPDSRNKDERDPQQSQAGEEWLVVTVCAPAAVGHDAVLALFDLGASAVQESPDGSLVTWIHAAPAAASVERRVRSTLLDRFGVSLQVGCRTVAGEDWLREWRRGLGPRRVGRRVVVAPSWKVPQVAPEEILVEIDPEMAFGTGEHGSTRTAIRLLETADLDGRRVLDVGAGSGILSIVAAKLGARVLALEVDPDAVRTAERNLVRNAVEDRVRVLELSVDRSVLELLRGVTFDVILVNVERRFIEPLLPAFKPLLSPAGALITAGILEEEAPGLTRAAEALGLQLCRATRDAGWWGGAFTPRAGGV